MKVIKDYSPPTPSDLSELKESLGYTGTQMADLAGVASNSQWRKYTGGETPVQYRFIFSSICQLN